MQSFRACRSLGEAVTSTALGVVALGLTAVPAFAQSYTFTTLDVPSATSYSVNGSNFSGSVATGINTAGQIVGYYYDSVGTHSFVYTSTGGFTSFNDPAAIGGDSTGPNGTNAIGINNAGQIVGGYTGSTGTYGFLYTPGGGYTQINNPAASGSAAYTFASGINTSGEIVGNYNGAAGMQGFVDTPGQGGMPSTLTTISEPMATGNTTARGVNNSGQIVGEYKSGNSVFGYLYTPGVGYTSLSDPAGPNRTLAYGVNDSGQVTGYYLTSTGFYSFVDTPGNGFVTLSDPLAVYGTRAQGINNLGQVVGYYTDANNVDHGFLATPAAVPEASTTVSFGLLLVLGLGGVVVAAKKKSAASA